jgi:hypothetical protein
MDNGENIGAKAVSPLNGQPVPNGRPKGVPNKATGRAREAIASFVEGNVDRLTGWLDEIAKKDPKAAYDCFMSVVEYHIPKLARTDNTHSGPDGGPIEKNVTVRYIDPQPVPVSQDTETL